MIAPAHAHTTPHADIPPTLPSARSDAAAAAQLPLAFAIAVRVYYEDTDAGGIVYYANWLRFFERARTEWLRSLGAGHGEIERESGAVFVVRDLAVDYRAPARLDDELDLSLAIAALRGASLSLRQVARHRGAHAVLVEARVRVAMVRRADGRPVPLPGWLAQRITGCRP